MSKIAVKLVPADDGKRMSLADFEHAESEDGRGYELSRGVITFMDVPNRPHMRPLFALKARVFSYHAANPECIHAILGGLECKLLIDELESERHPDLAIYLTAEPERDDAGIWREWIPEIVVEIVSYGSQFRDYEEKREEYLVLSIKEYWIVDVAKQEIHFLRRWRGEWKAKIHRPGDVYTTRLLPGFELPCADILEAV